jgi:hypothetical protein
MAHSWMTRVKAGAVAMASDVDPSERLFSVRGNLSAMRDACSQNPRDARPANAGRRGRIAHDHGTVVSQRRFQARRIDADMNQDGIARNL